MFPSTLTYLPAFMFFELINIKNHLFSLFGYLQWWVSVYGHNCLLWPFRGCEEDQTPAWLSVNLFKEVKALRDKGLNGDYEDGRTGICVFFLSSPGEQPLYLQGEAVAPCQVHSHSGSGEISCHPPPRWHLLFSQTGTGGSQVPPNWHWDSWEPFKA